MVAKMHRYHLPKVGEGVLYIPAGSPYEVDDEKQFPLGTYIRFGNKGFVYARSGGIIDTDMGVKNPSGQCIGTSYIGADAKVGDTEVVVTMLAGQGPDNDGNLLEDALVDGEIWFVSTETGWLNGITRRILGNTAITGGLGGDTTVKIDGHVVVALTEDESRCACMASPYGDVKNSLGGTFPVMGMATCPAVDGKYLWLQVEGPTRVTPFTDLGPNHHQQVVFRHDGGVMSHDVEADYSKNAQHAGFVICNLHTHEETAGVAFIMLQIAH